MQHRFIFVDTEVLGNLLNVRKIKENRDEWFTENNHCHD
ncbi:hypothetical protein FM107_15695 [Sphingobacterium sp. JB170]|nr:hypothetical protein FM107_15695 [Sphingobacterium sp. JB170]